MRRDISAERTHRREPPIFLVVPTVAGCYSSANTWRQPRNGRAQPLANPSAAIARGNCRPPNSSTLSPSLESSILASDSPQKSKEALAVASSFSLESVVFRRFSLRLRHIRRLGAKKIVRFDDVRDQVAKAHLLGSGLEPELVNRAWPQSLQNIVLRPRQEHAHRGRNGIFCCSRGGSA